MSRNWNRKKRGTPRWKIHAGVVSMLLLFVFSSVIAFPAETLSRVGFQNTLGIPDFRLGLDLQGGAHLVYEADMSQIADEDRANALEGVRDVVERRVNAFGVSEPLVQTTIQGGHYRVIVELAGTLDVSDAIAQIGETPILEFKTAGGPQDVELNPAQDAELRALNEEERVAAEAVLQRALAGEDFSALVLEHTIFDHDKERELPGDLGERREGSVYQDALADIVDLGLAPGTVLDELYDAGNGHEIIKFISGPNEGIDMNVSHILICHTESASEACASERSRDEAFQFATELALGLNAENFADTAREHSDDISAEFGGELGFVGPGDLVLPFEDAAKALEVGAVSTTPVETEFGFHLIHKIEQETFTSHQLQRIVMQKTEAADLVAPQDAGWVNTELSGRHLKASRVEFDPNTGIPVVTLDFESEGAKLFGNLTAENIGEQIAIFLDGEIITAPIVQQKISGGQAVITGTFTVEEANVLAQRLNAGALPVPIELLSQQTVGPTLGQISLEKSIQAALIGFALVAIFMMLYYRIQGVLAVLALILYVALNLLMYKGLDVTITLAGVAGFILSVGMAVDANVLIFERVREELKAGRDLPSAVDEGFRRAWTSIRDGNITTLIAAGILFWFSTSFIKGFALTLSIGILLSMFSAILVTRVLLKWIGEWGWVRKNMVLFGVKRDV